MLASWLSVSPAAAQQAPTDEIQSVNEERDWALGLYATAFALHGGGAVAFILAMAVAASDPCDFSATCTWITPTLATTAIAAGVGLLTFIPAIALDLDVRSRRRAASSPQARLQLAPTFGGARIAIGGRF